MKLAYGASDANFMACSISNERGETIYPYNLAWSQNPEENDKYYMHRIRLDGETYTKDIDVCDTYDSACSAYSAQMEYGYNNPRFPNVKMVSCEIVDKFGNIVYPFISTWAKLE